MTSGLATLAKSIRVTVLALWIGSIIVGVVFYLSNPTEFKPANIAAFIHSFESEIWFVYLAISALRGFTLLPSTPLVLAGTLLYPDQPILVLSISMAGILISSCLIYFGSEVLGFADFFETRKAASVERIRRRLEHPAGLVFVALWAFFPLVPTDAVCYVAGTTKMNFFKFISAVLVGELALCSIYVFAANSLLTT